MSHVVVVVSESDQNALLEDPTSAEFKGQLCRLQRHMIALLPHYTAGDTEGRLSTPGGGGGITTRLAVAETVANVLTFCRSIILGEGAGAGWEGVGGEG